MTKERAKFLLAGAALALGAAALSYAPPVPDRPAASVLSAGPRVSVASRWRTQSDTVRRGEALMAVLQRVGIGRDDAARALQSVTAFDPRKVRAGTLVTTRVDVDSGPAEIVFPLAIDRLVHLTRTATGWVGAEERIPWTTDTVVVAGIIKSTLVEAVASGASAFPPPVRLELAYGLADILEYRVDLSRDLQKGDSIGVLLERQRAPNGLVRPGRILAARLTVDGHRVETIRFEGHDTRTSYFDGDGKSMRAAFLRAPLDFRRISSVFGLRKHPILGIWRQHEGTDYSAAAGTPVRALGEGTVVFAGWRGGYGNMVEIRHRNGMLTRYGHMRAFASGIRAGVSVAISRTIGFVGMTGLATAPHLHFEVLVNGEHRDPKAALRNVTGEPLASADRADFAAAKSRLLGWLDAHLGAARASVGSDVAGASGLED